MKKLLSIVLCCALAAAPLTEVFGSAYDGPPYGGCALPSISVLRVNGQDIPVKDLRILKTGKTTMVPLRLVAEALGFKVTWDEETQTASLDDGDVQSSVTIGKDSYYKQSSQAIGRTAPMALGQVPRLSGGDTAYVPAEFFALLGSNENCVVIDGSLMTITYPMPIPEGNVKIPSPMRDYPTVEAALDMLRFKVKQPTLPEGYTLESIQTISGALLQLRYQAKDGKSITFRAANGGGNISGDYNTYTNVKPFETVRFSGVMKGDASGYFGAVWTDGTPRFMTYSLLCTDALTEETVLAIVESVL